MSRLIGLNTGSGLPGMDRVLIWFNDPANWRGPDGLAARATEHVVYTIVIVAVAAAVALPIGILIGHTGKGAGLVSGVANALRAVPSLGLLILLVVEIAPRIDITRGAGRFVPTGSIPYFVPVLLVLVVLAVPQILTNTYAGIRDVDPEAKDAARGLGMTGLQVIARVEIPCALPLILAGIRSATLQVIASLTVAAYAPLVGGLGRLIVDGDTQLTDLRYGYPAMVAAGIAVATIAVTADALLGGLQRIAVSPGVSGRYHHGRARAGGPGPRLRPSTVHAP